MILPAELHILGLIVAVFCIAYFAIYPKMRDKRLSRMMYIDLALFVVLFGIAGSVYAGTGMRFSLLVVQVNWWVFTLIAAILIEIPFFVWFCRKWGIDMTGRDD